MFKDSTHELVHLPSGMDFFIYLGSDYVHAIQILETSKSLFWIILTEDILAVGIVGGNCTVYILGPGHRQHSEGGFTAWQKLHTLESQWSKMCLPSP